MGAQAKVDIVAAELGVPRERYFHSRDTSFVACVKAATQGRGVGVVINSLTGDLIHSSSRDCVAPFGRFMEVGKRELTDAGRLDMSVFVRGATFDIEELFLSDDVFHRNLCHKLTL